MYKFRKYIVLASLFLLLNSFCSAQTASIKNKYIEPFLKNMEVDTFSFKDYEYIGVVYLFVRNVNDSILLQSLPSECVFKKEELLYSFYWQDKLFLCKGDQQIFKQLFDFSVEVKEKENSRTWRFCDECRWLGDYDPRTISLLIEKNKITEVLLSDNTRQLVIFGALPPPPIDNL